MLDMKYTTIPTLVMVLGSSFGASLLAPESVPATPIIPAASADAATVDTKAAEAVTDKDAPTVKSQIEAATKAYDEKSVKFVKKLRAEKDRTKQREIYNTRPSPTSIVDMILKLAKENPKSEGVEQGLVWSVRQAHSKQRKEVLDLLLTHYNENAVLGSLAKSYYRMRGDGGVKELHLIIEKTGNEKVRQGATYYLASKLSKSESTKDEGVAMMKTLQAVKGLSASNPQLHKQIESDLFVAENLSLGCTAPDIVGTDHDGKEFKLSDYKGQVVLLDFWGIW